MIKKWQKPGTQPCEWAEGEHICDCERSRFPRRRDNEPDSIGQSKELLVQLAAMSRAVGQLSRDIASAIDDVADEDPPKAPISCRGRGNGAKRRCRVIGHVFSIFRPRALCMTPRVVDSHPWIELEQRRDSC
jgi:hypothetical protein